MADVFISYSHKDAEYAHRLAAELRSQGLDVWIDDRIDYGDQWPRVIQDNLAASRVFVVIMSTNALNSMWVQNEVSYAQGHNKPIFPMLLEGHVWLSMAASQYADVRGELMPPARFADRLKRALGQPVLPEPEKRASTPAKARPRRISPWAYITGSLLILAVVGVILYAFLGPGFGAAPSEPTALPTEPPAAEVTLTEPPIDETSPTEPPVTEPPTEPPTTEAPPTPPPVTEEPVSAEFTSQDFHLAVGDVRTYKFGLATEGASGSAEIVQELGEVIERVVAREEGSNEVMEIFRVERSGDMVALDCAGEGAPGEIKTLWYIRDETRVFTACSEDERAGIVDALLRERLFSSTSEPELSTPSYVFPVTLNAKWSRWADIPVDEGARYVWSVEEKLDQKTTFSGTFENCYGIILRTNPDATIRYICKGVGLVGWFYRHFGTLKDYTGELWSYELAP